MKRSIIVLIFFFLLICNIIFAQGSILENNKNYRIQKNTIQLNSIKTGKSKTILGTLLEFTAKGEIFIYPIYFISVLGVAYFIENNKDGSQKS